MTDTIAAIATPFGNGGIGVIRISGPDAVDVVSRIFSRNRTGCGMPFLPESHRVCHGYIVDGGQVLDEVLMFVMRGPRSYTAEDVVEIQAHAGSLVLNRILERILSRGVRLADPGEFTRRAFLNQRIDLTQAEAVADIITARSESALKFAASQSMGLMRQEIHQLRDQLIRILAELEVSIDFPDDATPDPASRIPALDGIIRTCRTLIQCYQDYNFIKEGIRIVICGKPNVGKSSLMNRLLIKSRSIVTPVPGTTRDPVEDGLNLGGIPFMITDTAGIHDTDDLVEIIGIEKAKDHVREADLVLYMVEPGMAFSEREFRKIIPEDKKVIVVINKMDLIPEKNLTLPRPDGKFALLPVVEISALFDKGITALRDQIVSLCIQDSTSQTAGVIPNLRHKNLLVKVLESLTAARKGIRANLPEELPAIDIKNSIDLLGNITGETASLDILDTVFGNFCIGK